MYSCPISWFFAYSIISILFWYMVFLMGNTKSIIAESTLNAARSGAKNNDSSKRANTCNEKWMFHSRNCFMNDLNSMIIWLLLWSVMNKDTLQEFGKQLLFYISKTSISFTLVELVFKQQLKCILYRKWNAMRYQLQILTSMITLFTYFNDFHSHV